MGARIAAVVGELPPVSGTQEQIWDERFRHHYGDDAAAKRVWMRCGVERRHGVLDPIAEGVAEWGTGKRMERFIEEALPLGRQALEKAFRRAEMDAEEVDVLDGRLVHRLRDAGARHPARARPRPARRRTTAARRPHGLLRRAADARRRLRRGGGARQDGRACSASS